MTTLADWCTRWGCGDKTAVWSWRPTGEEDDDGQDISQCSDEVDETSWSKASDYELARRCRLDSSSASHSVRLRRQTAVWSWRPTGEEDNDGQDISQCSDEVDETSWSKASDDELARRFRLDSSSAIAESSSSDNSSMLSYLLYGDSRQPCATYDASLPHAASTRPMYGGDGFRGRVKYSGWYCTPTK